MLIPDIIYCANNEKYARIVAEYGVKHGLRLPAKSRYPAFFADQDWKNPDRQAYIESLRRVQPNIATVLDWEQPEQLNEILSWAEEAASIVSEAVIIIPKVHCGISRLPRVIGGKQVRLGYSVPTKYGGTEVFVGEFAGWPVHLLGGSFKAQLRLAAYLDVRSADGNYLHHCIKVGTFFDGVRFRQVRCVSPISGPDLPETILRWSYANFMAAWRKMSV